MNKRILKDQTGATFIDFFVICGIVVVLVIIAMKMDDVMQASYRKNCYSNQQSLDHVLHDLLLDNDYDLYQVLVAYTVFEPVDEMRYRMVVVLHPILLDPFSWMEWYKDSKEGEEPTMKKPFLVKDMTKHPYGDRTLCPLRKKKDPDQITVDYWYMPMQRWYCMHNQYHN